MIRQHMVCGICVYGPQTGRTEAEKEAFREEVARLAGLGDGQTMLFVAGGFSAHNGKDENWWKCLGETGWYYAGTFFQKKESHKITYMSGRHNTDLDLLVVRQQQFMRAKDCKALAWYHTVQSRRL